MVNTCDVCGKDANCRTIGKVSICEDCFSDLEMIRNYDKAMIDKYVKEDGMPYATEEGREFMLQQISYRINDIREKELLERKKREQEKLRKTEQERIANFICTTTPSIEGYEIVEYLGVISGEASMGTGFFSDLNAAGSDFFGTPASGYNSKLGRAKQKAINQMCMNAVQIGATAIVGVDIDILNTSSNIFLACANGTAVITRKKTNYTP